MRPARHTRRARAGFTLVELMVVITIIAILVALTAAAISLALGTAHKTQLRNEISELNKAVIAVQTEYNVKYIPSKIRLREDMAYGSPIDQLDKDSFAFLHAMWPRLTIGSQVDWNGDGAINGPWELEGEECLVFFTGGIPSAGPPATTLGFSTNPTNPAAAGGSTRKGPYFQYDSSRLIRDASNNFLMYGDTYSTVQNNALVSGQPYAYFSSFSYWIKNSSNVPVANRYTATGALATAGGGVSDCASIGGGNFPSPYADVAPNGSPSTIPHYLNNDTFQIISAGPDGVSVGFGQGSMNGASWSPASAPTTANITNGGGKALHNMANFYDNWLGFGQ